MATETADVLETAASHIRTALQALGYNVDDEHLLETPRRVSEVWKTFAPDGAPPTITTFDNPKVNQIVLAKNIQVAGMCPHHLLPWRGKAHVAYIPRRRIAGISKLVRTAVWASRRAATQEDVGNLIADYLTEQLEPMGVAVIINALHDCVACRGAEDAGITFTTSVMRGLFFIAEVTRAELMSLVGNEQ